MKKEYEMTYSDFLSGAWRSFFIVVAAIFSLALFWSCDNSLDPLDEDKGVYSIYGALDMKSDVNYIRVRELNIPIRDGEIHDFNGTVTLKNLTKGREEVLKDTLVEFDGIYVWNFESTMPIDPETNYEVSAERPDGRKVSATATTPKMTEAEVLTEFPDCTTTVDIQIAPFESGRIQADLGIEWLDQVLWIPYRPGFNKGKMKGDSFNMRFTPFELIQDVLELDEQVWCHELESDTFHYRYTHLGPDFHKSATSDTLIVPGGGGNFGAFYEEMGSFRIDTSNVCFPFCPR